MNITFLGKQRVIAYMNSATTLQADTNKKILRFTYVNSE